MPCTSSPLILYRFSVLPLSKDHRVALIQSLFKLLWKGRSPLVRRQVCYQRPRDGGLGMPDLESHRLAERLAYLGRSLTTDAVWSLKVRVTFPDLGLCPSAEGPRRSKDEPPFVIEGRRALRNLPRSSDLSWTRKRVSDEFRLGSSSRSARLVGGGDSLPVELGARFGLLEQLRVLAHLAASSKRVGPQRLGLQSVLSRYA